MRNYQIITDSGADLPEEMLQKLQIQQPLTLLFRGWVLEDSVSRDIKSMYVGLRTGENVATSAINPAKWSQAIQSVLESGQDALVLTFSSGLSTTYQSAVIAAQELSETYPEQKILVVDTRCASLGQGLLVWYACQKK